MGDHTLISLNVEVIIVVQEGLQEAYRLFQPLNMLPSPQCLAKKKVRYEESWIVESSNPKSFMYSLNAMLAVGEDGDSEALQGWLQVEAFIT